MLQVIAGGGIARSFSLSENFSSAHLFDAAEMMKRWRSIVVKSGFKVE